MNDFKVLELFQKGDVAELWQGVHTASNTQVHVLSVNKKGNLHVYDHDRLVGLEGIVQQANHPNILKYHKIVQNETGVVIIMEHPKVQKSYRADPLTTIGTLFA